MEIAFSELEECIVGLRSVEGQCDAGDLGRAVKCFLHTIDRESRIIFVRRYWYTDSVKEIAVRFGISDTAKYVVGDAFTLNVALSNEFMACLTKSNRTALIKSLEKTLSFQKISFKSINIIVDGQKING